ncbi:MAG TPA: hypothetical protein VFC44_02135 [Candidatus Saccharimonadales bacterium]|nr:hypothetical protein [Candidatus Saccharimonadales bacterium]
MKQERIEWDCGTTGVGVLVSDSLMFQRGDPTPSDPHLSQIYGLAMPLLKHGLPVTTVQLENVALPHFLESYRVLLLTYQGMKPLTPEVHSQLASWVKRGGILVVCEDDSDPYNTVREWWNSNGRHYRTPREHLFEQLGFNPAVDRTNWQFGSGSVLWLRRNPSDLAKSEAGAAAVVAIVKQAAQKGGLSWHDSNYLLLRRGPYLIAAGLDESIAGEPKELHGRFINLFDAQLRVQNDIRLAPGARYFLRDLQTASDAKPQFLASACRSSHIHNEGNSLSLAVEGVGHTPAVLLVQAPTAPRSVTLDGQVVTNTVYSSGDKLLWIRFDNDARSRPMVINY